MTIRTVTAARIRLFAALTAVGMAGTACGIAGPAPDDVVDYWLWNPNQLPAYQACADDFEAESGIAVRISQFVKDLHAGFQLLNLKNDFLRKKVDGIKYSVKKCEDVVYDLSLRNLIPTAAKTAARSVTSAGRARAVSG